MVRIKCRERGHDYDLGVYPEHLASEFHSWWRAYCPNRHYIFEALSS